MLDITTFYTAVITLLKSSDLIKEVEIKYQLLDTSNYNIAIGSVEILVNLQA